MKIMLKTNIISFDLLVSFPVYDILAVYGQKKKKKHAEKWALMKYGWRECSLYPVCKSLLPFPGDSGKL